MSEYVITINSTSDLPKEWVWELEGRGTVKRGFSHENWKVSVQQCFDREFQYQVVQSDCFLQNRC